ncbi:MAG: DUF72 domain-containing protein [Tistlia sp.]
MAERRTGAIRVGIGGRTFEPWRGGPVYPQGLAQKRELEYASRQLTSIEVNGTYYGSQKPESFARWREETPEGFVFSLKGPRFATNRRVLAEAGPSIERFLSSGLLELKDKLGPINWQFLPTKRYEAEDFEAFLKLLPGRHEGRALRHVVEVRHESFRVPGFVELLRRHEVGVVLTDKADFPQIADLTAGFVYARLQGADSAEAEGYPGRALDAWAARARAWAGGAAPGDLPEGLQPLSAEEPAATARDAFLYFINGFKPKAPAAARGLIERLTAAE